MKPTVGLLIAVLAVAAIRCLALDIDAPWGIITGSGVFDADEGWYTKAAQLRAHFGVWDQPLDITPFAHNPVHAFVVWLTFEVFGVGLTAARGVSVFASLLSLVFVYAIARTRWSRPLSLMAVLIVGVTFHNVAYGRLALLEPLGTCFALAGLYLWIRGEARALPTAGALICAALAVGVKLTFLAALATVAALVAYDAWRLRDEGWRRVSMRIGLIVGVALIGLAVHGLIRTGWPDSWGPYQRIVLTPRGDGMTFAKLISREISVWSYALPRHSGGRALWFFGMLGAVAVAFRHRSLLNPMRWHRSTLAMLTWLVASVSFIGISSYQMPRYFYPTLYPMVIVALAVVLTLVPRRWHLAAALILAGAHAGFQVKGFSQWLARDGNFSNAQMAAEVALAIEERESGTTVVMGHRAAFVSLFSDRLRPVELGMVDTEHYTLTDRYDTWQPRYLVESYTGQARLRAAVPDLVPVRIGTYPVMGGATYLYRLR